MEGTLILVSLAVGAALVTVLVSCLKCRRRLTEEEKHKKYFEIFRRSHIRKIGTLANRVDIIRTVIMHEQVSSDGMSSVDCRSEHSYEDLRTPGTPCMPVIQVIEASPSASEHSFFDDSFQTVIEASSSVMSSGNRRLSGLLGGTCANIPTYLDLQKPLQDAESMAMFNSSNLGEDNAGFSVNIDSNRFETNCRRSSYPGSGSYNIPARDPRIEVVHPSLRRKVDLRRPVLNPDTLSLYDLPMHSSDDIGQEKHSDKHKDLWKLRDLSTNNSGECNQHLKSNENTHEHSKETSITNARELTSEEESIYEKLKISKTTESVYKTLRRTLVLPHRPCALSPIMSPDLVSNATPSCQSEHTYESITSELAGEINGREWTEETDRKHQMSNRILDTPASRGSYSDNSGSITNSGHHTYASLKTPQTPAREEPQCVNSAVIIGRRVSNPFDKNKVAKRMINKKKLSAHNQRTNLQKNSSMDTSDGEQRYSPFPSAKKLAFKSAFKQIASPRLCAIPSVTGKLFSNSISKTEMCLNDLNTNTPEIKVENSAKCFNNTAFLSPFCLTKNILSDIDPDSLCFISPVCTYETLKNCTNLKLSNNNLDTDIIKKQTYYKKSLGSVTESLENEIIEHCNVNIYAMSTPSESHSQACDYF